MATVSAYKTIGAGFANSQEVHRVIWDYAVDGGATGALDLFVADGAMVIKDFHLKVLTACTSSGSATLKVGVSGGDDDSCLDTTSGAVANLGANAVIGPEATVPHYLADGGVMSQVIGTAALTAGKIEYVFTVMKA